MASDTATERLLDCGDATKRRVLLAELFEEHRARLRYMVSLRLDPRLRTRVDPSDALQDAYLEASRRLDEFLENPAVSFYVWIRRLTGQRLCDLHAHHLRVQKRSVLKEVHTCASGTPDASSVALVDCLSDGKLSPSQIAIRLETRARVLTLLDTMKPLDREILVLRFFERLSSREAAEALGIEEVAARQRFFRALKRLKDACECSAGEDAPPGS